jgi:hypothetical protein
VHALRLKSRGRVGSVGVSVKPVVIQDAWRNILYQGVEISAALRLHHNEPFSRRENVHVNFLGTRRPDKEAARTLSRKNRTEWEIKWRRQVYLTLLRTLFLTLLG